LAQLVPSPFNVRSVRPEARIEELAGSEVGRRMYTLAMEPMTVDPALEGVREKCVEKIRLRAQGSALMTLER
jgi:hypothetical protein